MCALLCAAEKIFIPTRNDYGLFSGAERYGNMTRVYYKEAVGCFIVFDVTRVSTFEVRDVEVRKAGASYAGGSTNFFVTFS